MGPYKGDFTTSDTVYFIFDTFSSDDPSASITMSGLAVTDIEVYKNGSTTQRASDAGYTLLDTDGIDFDSVTGIHGISIDLSNNTDAGFYTSGGEFDVVIASITVDAATVNFHVGSFSIDRIPRVNVHQISDDATAATNAEAFFDGTGYAGTGNVIPTVTTLTGHTAQTGDSFARIGATGSGLTTLSTAAALSTHDGKLDTVDTNVDSILTDTGTTIPATITTAQNDLDILTGADGVTLATTQANYAPNTTTPPTAAAIADQVWDEAKSGHVGAGSFGEEVQAHALSSEVATAQSDLDTITGSDGVTLATTQGNYAPATAAAVAALNDISVADVLTTQMTEAYAADGAAPTLAQALMLIQQMLGDFVIAGTTLTVRQVNGSTTAATFTLDDGTNPTSITRTT